MKTKLIVIWIGVMFLLSQFLFVEAEEYKNIRDLLPLTPLSSETQSQKIRVVKGGRLPLKVGYKPSPIPEAIREQVRQERATPSYNWATALWTIPTMANTPGRFGAFFKTKVVIYNPTTLSFKVEASLSSSTGFVETRNISLDPNTIYTWNDFLGDGFGFSGAGAVEFDSWFNPIGGSSDFEYTVLAEVYTNSPNGKFSTVVANGSHIDESWLNSSFGSDPVSLGINVNSQTRTNLGIFNSSSYSQSTVAAKVYDANNNLIETITFTMPPQTWNQKSITQQVTDGFVIWTADSTTSSCFLWSVSVDNVSNDGTLNWPSYWLGY